MIQIRGRASTIKENYEQKVNRDNRAKELKKLGFNVRRFSMRGQQMHPDYIKDYDGEGKGTGFGPNTHYRTYFAVIYVVEATREVQLFGNEN